MLTDHLTVSYYKALGSPNLTAAAAEGEKKRAEKDCGPKGEGSEDDGDDGASKEAGCQEEKAKGGAES